MVEITELNREPASTVSTLTATTEVTSPSVDATDVTSDTLNATTEVTSPSVIANALEADTLIGADVANASENQILVAQGDGTLAVETQAQGPNPYDQAQSFDESDVTLTLNDTKIDNGSISLALLIGTTATRDPDDDSLLSNFNTRGLKISPNADIFGIESTISTNTEGVTNATITRVSDGAQVASKPLDSFGSGDTFEIIKTLSSAEDYYLELTVDTPGLDSDPSFPYTSADIDIISGASGASDNSSAYCLSSVTAISGKALSGSATIEWDTGVPTDIFEWDVATFTRTLDNETVDVFVAYSDDGGSTWTRSNSGNPITRNYSLNEDANITADVDVRIETELSRADTANNPTLDSAYRSWLV